MVFHILKATGMAVINVGTVMLLSFLALRAA